MTSGNHIAESAEDQPCVSIRGKHIAESAEDQPCVYMIKGRPIVSIALLFNKLWIEV
jgi:hypothetical protein